MKEELKSIALEIVKLSFKADAVLSLPESKIELTRDEWDRFQEFTKQISLKGQEAFLLAAELKRQNNNEH